MAVIGFGAQLTMKWQAAALLHEQQSSRAMMRSDEQSSRGFKKDC
jgi:hypothetical protein